MTSTRAVAVLFVTACLAVAAPARAEPAANEQRGIELFEKGRELARDGRCAEAVPFFTASLEQAAAVGPLLNLGHCYELLGRTASAADAFARAAQVAGQRGDPRKQEAVDRERALEPVLSTLRVVVPRSVQPSVTELRVDGSPLPHAQWDVERRIDPGPHTIDIAYTARGHRTATVVVDGHADHVSYLVLSAPEPSPPIGPAAPPVSPPSGATSTGDEGSSQRSLGLVTGAGGLAGVVVGAVFGVLSLSARSDVRGMCPTYPSCAGGSGRATLEDRNDAALSSGTASTVAFISGGALLTLGAVLFLSAPSAR